MSAADATLQFPARIGLGTWHMGASRSARQPEVAAVAHALELGYRLFDTAEMYADGGAERVLGSALEGLRGRTARRVCIVSKVLPSNASRARHDTRLRSLARAHGLRVPGFVFVALARLAPVCETLAGFEELLQRAADPLLWCQQLRCRRSRTLGRCRDASSCPRVRNVISCTTAARPRGHRVRIAAPAALAWHSHHGLFAAGTGRLTQHPLLRASVRARGHGGTDRPRLE
jgi:hypothetical protein